MRAALAGLVVLGSAGIGVAGGPVAPPPELVQPLPPLGYYRVSAYEVWQNLAVDGRGYFRPRVIYGPYGAYYRYNGQPFPWASTRQLDFTPTWMPYAAD